MTDVVRLLPCDVCFFEDELHEAVSVVWFLEFRCVHCEAMQAEPLHVLQDLVQARGDQALWTHSILTCVQSPRSKGVAYCEFQDLVEGGEKHERQR